MPKRRTTTRPTAPTTPAATPAPGKGVPAATRGHRWRYVGSVHDPSPEPQDA